jgi:hypothetical protein
MRTRGRRSGLRAGWLSSFVRSVRPKPKMQGPCILPWRLSRNTKWRARPKRLRPNSHRSGAWKHWPQTVRSSKSGCMPTVSGLRLRQSASRLLASTGSGGLQAQSELS